MQCIESNGADVSRAIKPFFMKKLFFDGETLGLLSFVVTVMEQYIATGEMALCDKEEWNLVTEEDQIEFADKLVAVSYTDTSKAVKDVIFSTVFSRWISIKFLSGHFTPFIKECIHLAQLGTHPLPDPDPVPDLNPNPDPHQAPGSSELK